MPPKKDKQQEPPQKVINFYERMDKKFLDNAENPNFHLHHLKVPFRMCIVAPSGSGKTNFLLNIIHLFSQGKGTFADLSIITRNKDEPLYRFLQSKNDQINIKEGLENVPQLDKFDKEINHLVVFDDLVLAKDQRPIENYYIRARKLNCSVIYISQSYFKIPKIIRNNCSYMCLLKLSGQREVNMILSEFGLGVSKEQLLALYQYATKEKFVPLLIDMEAEPQDRFRKGFLEVLAVREEGERYEPQ
jgi:ABC-type dipeptide/oligopeptide/nickel transport system ATPase component